MFDSGNQEVKHYPDVPDIFRKLLYLEIPIGFASR